MVLHQLNDDTNIIRVVFYGNNAHDVGSILGVGVLAIFVGQNETGVGFMNLIEKDTLVAFSTVGSLVISQMKYQSSSRKIVVKV
jgi:hypothetical protein